MLCKIWGFHGGDYEEWRLLGCYAAWLCVRRLLVTGSVVPSSPILVTLTMKALSSSETSVLTRATRRNVLEDSILHSASLNMKPSRRMVDWRYSSTILNLCIR
jgi:hypothetical protein